MEKLKGIVRATPFLGLGFVVGAVLQMPVLLANGMKKTAIMHGVLFILGAIWAVIGFKLRRSNRQKMIRYLEAEGFDLSQVKDKEIRAK